MFKKLWNKVVKWVNKTASAQEAYEQALYELVREERKFYFAAMRGRA